VGMLWDVTVGQRLALLDGHRGAVRAAAFAPDGKLLASAGSDRRVLLYDLPPPGSKIAELRERTVLEGHKAAISCLVFSPDSRLLASGSDLVTRKKPAEVVLWDVASGKALASWNEHTGDVAALAFHPTRPVLVSGGADPGFRI